MGDETESLADELGVGLCARGLDAKFEEEHRENGIGERRIHRDVHTASYAVLGEGQIVKAANKPQVCLSMLTHVSSFRTVEPDQKIFSHLRFWVNFSRGQTLPITPSM